MTPKEALELVLDQIDYTNGACGPTEMVGACLPVGVIATARRAINDDSTGVEFLHRWMRAPNPMLGNITPLNLLKAGRGAKLAKFIESADEANSVIINKRG